MGRIPSLDVLIKDFKSASTKEEKMEIAQRADAIATQRKGRDGIAASLYVKTYRVLIGEKSEKKYIDEEAARMEETLKSLQDGSLVLEGDARCRIENGANILAAFKQVYAR